LQIIERKEKVRRGWNASGKLSIVEVPVSRPQIQNGTAFVVLAR
jgi:hypothetical protein